MILQIFFSNSNPNPNPYPNPPSGITIVSKHQTQDLHKQNHPSIRITLSLALMHHYSPSLSKSKLQPLPCSSVTVLLRSSSPGNTDGTAFVPIPESWQRVTLLHRFRCSHDFAVVLNTTVGMFRAGESSLMELIPNK